MADPVASPLVRVGAALAVLLLAFLAGRCTGGRVADQAVRDWQDSVIAVRAQHAEQDKAVAAVMDSLRELANRPRPALPPVRLPGRVDTLTVPVPSADAAAWRAYANAQRARADSAEAQWALYGERARVAEAATDTLARGLRRALDVIAVRDSQVAALRRLVDRAPVGAKPKPAAALELLGGADGLEVAGEGILPLSGRVALMVRAAITPAGSQVRAGARIGL